MLQPGCERNCKNCLGKLCARRIPIFSSLSHEELESISKHVVVHQFRKGDQVVSEGSTPNCVAIISGGNAKAYTYTPDGREQILYLFSEGDFFGEQYLLRKQAASYTVEALEPLEICKLHRESFDTLLTGYSSIARKVIEELSSRIVHLESTVQHMGARSVDARISGTLLEFADKYGRDTPDGILVRLPLSREGIANYLGIARETVSRKFSQLENEGVIRTENNKALMICDIGTLKTAAGIN